MNRRLRHRLMTLALPAIALAAVVVPIMSGSQPAAVAPDRPTFVAVGSSSNNANPVCSGKKNSTCTSNGPTKTFSVFVGEVHEMYPGSTANLPVTFANPQSFDIEVTTVAATAAFVADQAHPAGSCASSDVVLGAAQPLPKTVPARSTTTDPVMIPLGLSTGAGDGCKGAQFTITVSASGVNP